MDLVILWRFLVILGVGFWVGFFEEKCLGVGEFILLYIFILNIYNKIN